MAVTANIPSTMQAGQWDVKQQAVVINEVPVPVPGPNEFLVKMKSASLCHSDMMAIKDNKETVTLGHEGLGYIVSMHPSAEGHGLEIGDAVGFLYILGCCFSCSGCMIHNLYCETGKQKLQGFTTDGFFSEYAIVDYHNAVKLNESKWNLDTGCAIFCAGITAFHSIDSCELSRGDWFGVVGCGGLGQIATQYAKAMGLKVVAIDIQDENLEETRKQGADAVFNSKDPDYAEEIRKLTNGGCQAVAVYTNSHRAYQGAPSIIKLGGTLMVIGIPSEQLSVSYLDIVMGRFKIKSDSTSIPQRMGKAIAFTEKHGISPVVEVRGGLDALPGMVKDMEQGKVKGRTGVVFS
ncbi:hypothetical protein FZEAL_10591 [Fusarium zealandicum]|uniref:Enoyl reductase (ER) domain-containing protein n=1 Tax=Fusarium zealandicum TaxID=1053134 RepID=A0A8H4TZX7_9HYPO|nr:hypothetical protein FZEAL_10591 [Fusarium zealandicum]